MPGAWEGNLCTVGADSRLDGTLLSLHDYTLYTLGGETHPTEADWITSFENDVCGYDSRAVLTEFGVPMTSEARCNATWFRSNRFDEPSRPVSPSGRGGCAGPGPASGCP